MISFLKWLALVAILWFGLPLANAALWWSFNVPCVFCGMGRAAETCIASQYGVGDGYHGKRTASGERFNTHALTAAHRSRGFGSHVTVTNLANRRSVRVRITDRGPFVRGRCIDLSRAGANAIGMGGTALVSVQ